MNGCFEFLFHFEIYEVESIINQLKKYQRAISPKTINKPTANTSLPFVLDELPLYVDTLPFPPLAL